MLVVGAFHNHFKDNMDITLVGVPQDGPMEPPQYIQDIGDTPAVAEEFGGCLEFYDFAYSGDGISPGYDSYEQTINQYVHRAGGTAYNPTEWFVQGENGTTTEGFSFDWVVPGNHPAIFKYEFVRSYNPAANSETWRTSMTMDGTSKRYDVISTFDPYFVDVWHTGADGNMVHKGTYYYSDYD